MRILLLETLHPDAEELLRGAGEVVLAHEPNGADPLRHVAGADAVLTRGRGRIDAALLAAGTGLRAVARCGAGLDNVDVGGATRARHSRSCTRPAPRPRRSPSTRCC